jgi:hypothetical protein
MEDPVANAILTQYFRRLEEALSDVPVDRRTQIVEDLRAHVEECLEAEPEHSDAAVMAMLDRVGDPDDIAREAREALLDETPTRADASVAGSVQGLEGSARPGIVLTKLRIAAAGIAALVVVGIGVLSLSGGQPARARGHKVTVPTAAPALRLVASRGKGGWLPASAVSGDHQSLGASDCSPQTTAGSESASTLESSATKVAAGSVAGQSWSVWSKKGQSGSNGIENGGVVINGVAYGLCPGFPNPGEMELLDPSSGGNGVAYGVVGYAGSAKVAIYADSFGNFATGKLLATTTAQKVNGVGFFITPISESACDVSGIELNTASTSYATEHNLAFSTSNCSKGQLVPISNSQGIWQLATSGFPDKFQNGGGGGGLENAPVSKNGWLAASDISGDHQSPGASSCSPQTTSGSESASTLESSATKVASGSVGGQSWSVWSKQGQSGSNGIEDGGIEISGVAYGLCPGFPNPGEMELLEPSGGGNGVAYGVVGYAGSAKVAIYADTFGNFATGKLLATTVAQKVNGVGFFITPLSESACDVAGIEMNTASSSQATEHNLAFSTHDCKDGQLVPISDSQGIWGLPTSGFPNKFQSGGGGGAGAGGGGGGISKSGWLPASDISGGGGIDDSDCSPQTTSGLESASTLETAATKVASGSTDGQSWSVWSKKGESGANGIEDGGVVINGAAHGLCPGFPNPAEMEMFEPAGGGNGFAYGVVGYAGTAKVAIYSDTFGNFATNKLIATATAQKVNGVGFFFAPLSESACHVQGVEMNTASANYAAEHNLAFSTEDCKDGQLVPISDSQGIWQLATKDFPDKFQSFNGGEGSNSTPTVSGN